METLWESNALTNSGFDTPPFELPMFLLISPGTELTPNGLVTAVIFHLWLNFIVKHGLCAFLYPLKLFWVQNRKYINCDSTV